MNRILIVDDDDAIRTLSRLRLEGDFEIMDTGEPERAFLMALQNKPDAILLDLSMPGVSGFELCRTFASLSLTQRIPIFVISGKDVRNKAFCEGLGASGYFEKPIDYGSLKKELRTTLLGIKAERRKDARTQVRVILKLRGMDKDFKPFEVRASTENMSASGFLCTSTAPIEVGLDVQVFLCCGGEHYVGFARAVRTEQADAPYIRFGFQFVEKPIESPQSISPPTPTNR